MNEFELTRSDFNYINKILDESSDYDGCNRESFFENLLEVTDDPEFRTVLRQFLNHSAAVNEITVNGHDLSDILEKFDDQRIGLLVTLPLMHLEKYNEDYRHISLFAAETVGADSTMLDSGEPPTILLKTDLGWIAGNDFTQDRTDEEPFCESAMWQLLLTEPLLIPHMMMDYPDGTQLYIDPDPDTESGRCVKVYLPEEPGGDEA